MLLKGFVTFFLGSTIAFFSKVGSLLKQSVTNHTSSIPSLFQAIRSMSSSKLFIGGLSYCTDDGTLRDAFVTHGEAASFPAPAPAPDFNGYKGARVDDICQDDAISCRYVDEDGKKVCRDDEDEFGIYLPSSLCLSDSSDDDGISGDHFTFAQPKFHPEASTQFWKLSSTINAMNTSIIFENWAAFQEAFYNLCKNLEVIIKYKNRPMAYLEAIVNFEMSLTSFMSYKNLEDRMGSSNAEAYVSLRRKLEGSSQKARKKVKLIDDNQLMEHPSKMVSDMIDTKLNEIGARIGMQKVTRKVGGIEQLSYIGLERGHLVIRSFDCVYEQFINVNQVIQNDGDWLAQAKPMVVDQIIQKVRNWLLCKMPCINCIKDSSFKEVLSLQSLKVARKKTRYKLARVIRWMKSIQNSCKLNNDGSSRGSNGMCVCGGIVRDHTVIDLISFSNILYGIYPPLFVVLLAYSLDGIAITVFLGRGQVTLNFLKEKKETNFCYGLVRIRENVESIAFYGGEENEMQLLLQRFKSAFENLTAWISI
ncbi:hypothetical protein GIB67_008824 [Kingdonia uniflora]|uniref:ABC transmembrane type-1 domain-containing protein n=1 Tax=Kingdonia uniflora TaxID=39325 RepID=A0A7J7LVE9_9MAGN|nr:hypothetical protein GIB67_008824 [Kingdonia uniflora]